MAAPWCETPAPDAPRGPWTEEQWGALPENPRVELLDGTLLVSPNPANPHQRLAYRLFGALDGAAPEPFDVLGEPNVRLAADRVLIPDLAVGRGVDRAATTNPASAVVLVVEVVSPSSASLDRVLKPRLYAEAGIDRYLRIELDGPTGHLHELVRGAYVEVAASSTITLVEPFPVVLDLPRLAR